MIPLTLAEARRLAVAARAFVTPFDSLVWAHGQGNEGGVRSRVLRLFGMKYRLEIYVPPHRAGTLEPGSGGRSDLIRRHSWLPMSGETLVSPDTRTPTSRTGRSIANRSSNPTAV